MKRSSEIRQLFLDYFHSRAHTIVESAALVPRNDPSLLFTNAGMVQFKDVFLGRETRSYCRAASSQKCMRAGGKHNDLENVGHTARHHTFFEMLGNFSFGDYFKREAIAMAWEFITGVLEIDPARLWITIYEDDAEARHLWEETPGVPTGRVLAMGEKDNFWSMGDTGPCGPCSEILIDQGERFSCGRPGCAPGCDCDRYLELWNLVFMQFDRDAGGHLSPLPRPSIDTGMGLERITAVLQHAASNYDTDLFRPLLEHVARAAGVSYGACARDDASLRIIADHSRATAFLIADGVLPSNEGRGYVLRRIMRRAARRGRMLGLEEPFLHEVVRVVAGQMEPVYPELMQTCDYIGKVVLNEERGFAVTIAGGLKMLEEAIGDLQGRGERVLAGETAFKLYDTYGFPLDLTADIAREHEVLVDEDGFQQAMAAQRTRARQAWKGSGGQRVQDCYREMEQAGLSTQFQGYDALECDTDVQAIVRDGERVGEAAAGEQVEIVAPVTPFYGESGGQSGDRGTITGAGFCIDVTDTVKPLETLTVHVGTVRAGMVRAGDRAHFAVDGARRQATARNHTATHLLQAVLRQCLGDHVKQAGSLVTPERLRFDFTHFEQISDADLRTVEARINALIRDNRPVTAQVVSREEATALGATALFGEKYGEAVRVIGIPDCSLELCGGTHAHATGDLGLFKLAGQSAVAAGVRRIEALTGEGACACVQAHEDLLDHVAGLLKSERANVPDRIERLLARQRELEREVAGLQARLAAGQAGSLLDQVEEIGGVRVLTARMADTDPKALRSHGDRFRDRIGSGIVVFGAAHAGKAHLLVMVTPDLTGRFRAGDIIAAIAPVVGGRGGGRADMAQAGGKDPSGIDAALGRAREVIAAAGSDGSAQ